MRVKSIDFLRGVAIILVLFAHIIGLRNENLVPFLHQFGWVGVDLFFVLSGFLVSGLLFNEYNKTKTVQSGLFLIRRGFKIYPLFYIVLGYVVLSRILTGSHTSTSDLIPELFFFQNYAGANILYVSWSLAVEEHFYILLIIAISVAIKLRSLENKTGFHIFTGIVLAYCLTSRIITSINIQEFNNYIHYTPTHLRIDSLTFGTILAYNYHFNRAWLQNFVQKHSKKLATAFVIMIMPVFVLAYSSVFIRTIGFTLNYLAFGSLLLLFVFNPIKTAQTTVGNVVYTFISRIGIYSYGIYLLHIPLCYAIAHIMKHYIHFQVSNVVLISLYLLGSIVLGILATRFIEMPILNWRDRLYPRTRVAKQNTNTALQN
jgi:peptidoglycan/LPS O-acetylase OafA/YrhL